MSAIIMTDLFTSLLILVRAGWRDLSDIHENNIHSPKGVAQGNNIL